MHKTDRSYVNRMRKIPSGEHSSLTISQCSISSLFPSCQALPIFLQQASAANMKFSEIQGKSLSSDLFEKLINYLLKIVCNFHIFSDVIIDLIISDRWTGS